MRNTIGNRMTNKNWMKRFVSLLAAFSMIITSGGLAAFAEEAAPATIQVLTCGMEEGDEEAVIRKVWTSAPFEAHPVHVHQASCYDEDGKTVCGYAEDLYYHSHNEYCYDEDGTLVCGLREGQIHRHTDACRAEDGTLICNQIGYHVHSAGCWDGNKAICGEIELPEYVSGPDNWVEETVMVPHVHDASCYTEQEVPAEEPEQEPNPAEPEEDQQEVTEPQEPEEDQQEVTEPQEPEEENQQEATKEEQQEPAKETTEENPDKTAPEAEEGEQDKQEEQPAAETPEETTQDDPTTEQTEVQNEQEEQPEQTEEEQQNPEEQQEPETPAEPETPTAPEAPEAPVTEPETPAEEQQPAEEEPEEQPEEPEEQEEEPEENPEENPEDEPEENEPIEEEEELTKTWDIEPEKVETRPFFAGEMIYRGKDYKVIVHVDEDAQLPADVELRVQEILPGTDQYFELTGIAEDTLTDNWSKLSDSRFFDIAFIYDGAEIEPAAEGKVNVQILFDKAIDVSDIKDVQGIHIDDEGTSSEVNIQKQTNPDEQVESVTFSSNSFSVYGVIQIEQILTKTIRNYARTYVITVSYSADAKIPEGCTLQVTEIKENSEDYALYANQTAAALKSPEEATELFGLYDISIITPEGEKIQPSEDVTISIKLLEENKLDQIDDLKVVHFHDDISQTSLDAEQIAEAPKDVVPELEVSAEVITPEVKGQDITFESVTDVNAEQAAPKEDKQSETSGKGSGVTFKASSFSVFALAYTVDFHYEGVDYSIEGNSQILLSELIEMLNVRNGEELLNVHDVENVTFTDEHLVTVQQVSGLITYNGVENKDVGDKDFLLSSLEPFTSDEKLIITLVDGTSIDNTIVIDVTDEQPVDITNLLDSAVITVNGNPVTGDDWNVVAGENYGIKLTFTEKSWLQFPDDDTPMVYQLPSAIQAKSLSGTFSLPISIYGRKYTLPNNRYTVAADGTITIQWNTGTTDEERRIFGYLKSSDNVRIDIDITGSIPSATDPVIFSSTVSKTVTVTEPHDVSISKTGAYNASTGNVDYTVTVKSKGNNSNIVVTDTLNGTALILNHDVTASSGNVSTSYGEKSFTTTISSMSDGETITLRYSAQVDKTKIGKSGNATYDETNNSVKLTVPLDDNPSNDEATTSIHDISFSNLTKEVTSIGELVPEGSYNYKTVSWQIVMNNHPTVSMAGSKIIDRNGTSWAMSYLDGITVTAYRADGSQAYTKTIAFGSEGLTKSGNDSWEYTIPSTDTEPYKYVIDYQTKVNVTNQALDFAVSNHAEGKGGNSGGSYTIGGDGGNNHGGDDPQPDDQTKVDLKKSVTYSGMDRISWKIRLIVPAAGYPDGFKLVDYLPSYYYWSSNVNHYDRDPLFDETEINSNFTITGLVAGETWDAHFIGASDDDWNKGREKGTFEIVFYKNGTDSGLAPTNADRLIEITYDTRIDEDTQALREAAYASNPNNKEALVHYNKTVAYVNNENKAESQAHATPRGKNIVKTFAESANLDGRKAVLFQIQLTGVQQDEVVVQDIFDTDIFEVYSGNVYWQAYACGGNSYGADESTYAIMHGSVVPTSTGANLIIPTPRSNSTGAYADYYYFKYYLVYKDDAEALMFERAAHNGGEATTTNIANFGTTSSSADVTFTYEGLTKEQISYDSVNNIGSYRITLNPSKVQLNGGRPLKMTDTMVNLSIIYASVKYETDPAGRESQISFDYKGNTGTFIIPDETKVIITYDAKVIGNAGETVSYSNTAEMSGFTDGYEGEGTFTADFSGGATVYNINIYKYKEGHMETGLNGAVFQIFDENKNPILNRTGNPITFTTSHSSLGGEEYGDQDGYVIVLLDRSRDGIALQKDTRYYLKEIQTPDNDTYAVDNTYYGFMISDSANYSQYIYHNNDTLKVYNTEKKGQLVVKKTLAGAANLTQKQKEAITFIVERTDVASNTEYYFKKEFTYADFVDGEYRLESLPAGTYRVEETGAEIAGYTLTETTVKVDNESETSGAEVTGLSVAEDSVKQVEIKNTYTSNNAQITIVKVNNKNVSEHLFGAEFQILKKNGSDYEALSNGSLDANGKFIISYANKDTGVTISGLEDGEYRIVETKAPTGYTALFDTIDFTVSGNNVSYAGGITAVEYSAGTFTIKNKKATEDVSVTKEWVNANGTTTWPEGINSVSVKIRKKVGDAEPVDMTGENVPSYYWNSDINDVVPGADGSEWSDTITLNSSSATGGWSKLDADDDITYVVTETAINGIAVSDGTVTINGKTYEISESAVSNGSATITNTERTADMSITVQKVWSDGAGAHTGDDVTIKLIRYKKSSEPSQGGQDQPVETDGTLTLSHTVSGEGLSTVPSGFTYTATNTSDNTQTTLSVGNNTLPAGTYNITVNDSSVSHPEGYTYGSTSVNDSPVEITAGDTSSVTVTSTYTKNQTVSGEKVKVTCMHVQQRNVNYNHTSISVGDYSVGTTITITYTSDNITSDIYVNNDLQTSFNGSGTHTYQYTIDSDKDLLIEVTDPWYPNGIISDVVVSVNTSRKNPIDSRYLFASTSGRPSGNRDVGLSILGYEVDTSYDKTITLSNGHWSETVTELPVADGNGDTYYYAIEEGDFEGYSVTYSENYLQAAVGTYTLTATNTPDTPTTCSLIVTKTVTGNARNSEKEFNFTVALTNRTDLNGTYGEMAFTDGVATFTLTDGDTKTASGLPAGTTYTVVETEENQDGYTTTKTGDTGTIAGGETAVAAFTNDRTVANGSITLQKLVAGEGADDQKDFSFTITILKTENNNDVTDTDFTGEHGGVTFTNGVATIALKHNGTVTISDLPYGTKYRIEETADAEYQTNATVDGEAVASLPVTGTITSAETISIIFTNTKIPITSITASKVWSGVDAAQQPTAIQLTLKRQVGEDTATLATVDTAVLTKASNWASVTWDNLPVYVDATAAEKQTYTYSVVETGVYFGELDNGAVPADGWIDPDMYTVTGGTVTTDADTGAKTATITNAPVTVDVPLTKNWSAYNGNGYYWEASFQLEYVDVHVDGTPNYDGAASNYIAVPGVSEKTIHKGQDQEERTFDQLPMYHIYSNGAVYRVKYAVTEKSYSVWTGNDNTGTLILAWDETNGLTTGEDLYTMDPVHDAGDLDITVTSADDSRYYSIIVDNVPDIRTEDETIDISIRKDWDDTESLSNDRYASFKIQRMKSLSYREFGNAYDGTTNYTVTLDGQAYLFPAGSNIYLVAEFASEADNGKVVYYRNNNYLCEIGKYSTSQTVHRTNQAVITNLSENVTITINSGRESILSTYPTNIHHGDTSDSPDTEWNGSNSAKTVTLNSGNNWTDTTTYRRMMRVENGNVNSDENGYRQTVYTYSYYFVEQDMNPTGYYSVFTQNNASGAPLGSQDYPITSTALVYALNKPIPTVKVKKVWRGAPDATGFPEITFTLYQVYTDSNNQTATRVFTDDSGTSYDHIPLNDSEDNNWTWTCPVNLPYAVNGKPVRYYVREDVTRGQDSTGVVSWELYGYGKDYNAETQTYAMSGNQDQYMNVYLAPDANNEVSGEIEIHNKLGSEYLEMDIKKQFFDIREAGSWYNITSTPEMTRGIFLGIQVIRRIVAVGDRNTEIMGWHDYGNEMLVGYDDSGTVKVDNGGNEYFLKPNSNSWEFTIHNNNGQFGNYTQGQDNVGLPKRGFYTKDDGTVIPVSYEYCYREVNVYRNMNKDPYPEWEWVSSVLPDRTWWEGGQVTEVFGRAFENHDGERIVNYKASNITIDKRWLGVPDALEVYVKIWRKAGNAPAEDFTAIIAKDVIGYAEYGLHGSNWQGYVENTSVVDTTNNCLILKSNTSGNWTTTIKTHKAMVGAQGGAADGTLYDYYLEEIGYKDKDGIVHLVKDDAHALDIFETRYTKWDPSTGQWLDAAVVSGADASIKIGSNDTNKLQVMNAPMMDLTVTKKWVDENGDPRAAWNNSVKFMVKQTRTKWVGGVATDEKETVYLTVGNNNRVFTLHQSGQAATLTTNHVNHDQYAMTVADNADVEAWTMVISGLQRGFFDEQGYEWHCEYVVEEVDSVLSSVTVENPDIHHETVTITNTYDEKKAAVKVTKTFSGVDALPANFTITAVWKDGENNTGNNQSKTLTPSNAQSGDGKNTPYVWTINEIPLGNNVTFTETHYTVDGLNVTAKVNAVAYAGAGDPNGTAIAGNPNDEDATKAAKATLNFANEYGTMPISIYARKAWTQNGTALDAWPADVANVTFQLQVRDDASSDWADLGDPVTVANGNAVHWDNLDSAKQYQVIETKIGGTAVSASAYSVTGTGVQDNPFVITNPIEPVTIRAKKNWPEGQTVPDGISVTLTISATVPGAEENTTAAPDGVTITPASVTLDGNTEGDTYETTAWEYSWANLPKYDNNGKLITYSVTETAVTYNNTAIRDVYTISGEGTGTNGLVNINNTPKTVDLTVNKEWFQNNVQLTGESFLPDATITVKVEKSEDNGTIWTDAVDPATSTPITGVTLGRADNWSKTWNALPAYTITGTAIQYRVTETAAKVNTTDSLDVASQTAVAFTNGTATLTNNLPTRNIVVEKAWSPTGWPDGIASVQVGLTRKVGEAAATHVMADGTNRLIMNITSANEQKVTFEQLPKYDNTGALITYAVEEISVTPTEGTAQNVTDGAVTVDGKTWTVLNGDVSANGTATVTNTLTGISIRVTKQWKQNSVDKTFDGDKSIGFTLHQVLTNAADSTDKKEALYTGVTGHTDGKFTIAYTANTGWAVVDIPNLPRTVTETVNTGEGSEAVSTTVTYNASYYVVEDPAPSADAGYVLATTYSTDNGTTSVTDGKDAAVNANNAKITIINTETAGVELPGTGGPGTMMYTIGGLALILLAGVLLIGRKRKYNR